MMDFVLSWLDHFVVFKKKLGLTNRNLGLIEEDKLVQTSVW